MAKNISVKLELNAVSKILLQRGLQDNGPVQRFAASELKRMCDPYVPFLSGTLKNTAQVQNDGVLYVQPYSQKQYNGNGGSGQRGKQWDKRMMADHGKEYISAVAKKAGGEAG